MAKLKCIAYISKLIKENISPLYEVSIELDGDERLVELLKDQLSTVSMENLT